MMSLDERDYPFYLKKAYLLKFGCNLNLRRPKTINEKIQWLKIYDNKPIKSLLTDKVLVRNWVKEKIGSEYLKPVFQICNNFDEINFSELPDSFVVKCNHGCKWHYIVKDKRDYISNSQMFDFTKNKMNDWLKQNFFGWSDFETQYKNISPQIIIEQLMRENIDESPLELEVWCFNSIPEIIQKSRIAEGDKRIVSVYDKDYRQIDLKFVNSNIISQENIDNNIKDAVELSKKLASGFKLVRIDWMIYKNKLYFGEMTFTPFSGFILFDENYKDWYLKLGKMLNLKGD